MHIIPLTNLETDKKKESNLPAIVPRITPDERQRDVYPQGVLSDRYCPSIYLSTYHSELIDLWFGIGKAQSSANL